VAWAVCSNVKPYSKGNTTDCNFLKPSIVFALGNDAFAFANKLCPPDLRPILVSPLWIYDYYITIELEMELPTSGSDASCRFLHWLSSTSIFNSMMMQPGGGDADTDSV
jgi:hypothetical protein